MKTIKQIIPVFIFIGLMFTGSGCEDFLTRDHPTQIGDEDFWKTVSQVTNAQGQMKRWPHGAYHTDYEPNIAWIHMEGMTDNQYFMSNFRQEVVNLGNGSATATTGGYINMVWKRYYEYIRRANRILENIHRVYFSDEEERDWIIQDTRVWRAWYHMQLLLLYGRHDGIPIVEHSLTPEENFMARNTVEECLEWINSEFDEVINSNLTFLWDESRRTRMSKSSALVLKMDLNLQFKRYEVAKTCAETLINSGIFSLYYTSADDDDPGKNYRDLFLYTGLQNEERIIFTSSGNKQAWFRLASVGMGGSGQGTGAVLKSLVDEYETIDGLTLAELPQAERTSFEREPLWKERDPRLYTSVLLPGDNTSFVNYSYEPFDPDNTDYVGSNGASRSGYIIKKFLVESDRNNNGRGTLAFMTYRYAEVLLTYVECLVETGDWQHADVERYINMIRNRAGMPDMDKTKYNTQEKVRELYRRERRIELAFEGKRYDDIRRWGIGSQVMTGRAEGAWNPNNNAFVVIEERNCTFPKNDSWPIPIGEITTNENITQPTGW